jgi:pimeloyl-ACP methyl ester carboxylesterase
MKGNKFNFHNTWFTFAIRGSLTIFVLNISSTWVSWHSGTVPAKVLLQLTTAFRDGGLCNRSGTFFFKEHLHKIKVPVLALAGDEDLICPPEAVYGLATTSIFPLLLCNEEILFIEL